MRQHARERTFDSRVLFVHQSSDLYGSDRMLMEIAHALRRAGGQPIVVLPGDGPLVGALQERGVEVHSVEPAQVLKLSRGALSAAGVLRLLAAVPRSLALLDNIVDGRSIQWVHSNTLAVLGGALWSRWRRVEHVWHVHEMVRQPRAAATALPWLAYALADTVVCNSHATRDWLVASQPRLAARARVVWNGVEEVRHGDGPVTSVRSLAAAFRTPDAPRAVGLIGRINRMKGHELLLEAAEQLHAEGRRDFTLVFIGSAPPGQEHFADRLRERIAMSPLADRVRLYGFMPDVSAAYAALDIVCVPSTEAEAFGLVAVEAMAARLPVLAARIGGLPEVVTHGKTGLLHAPGNAAELAHHLAQLLDNPAQRAAFGAAGRARFEADFTLRAMTLHFLDLFSMRRAGRRFRLDAANEGLR